MKFKLLHIYTLLSLAFVGSHALSPKLYWKSVLPNTPMPKSIKDLLYTKAWDDGKEKNFKDTAFTYIKLKDQTEGSKQSYSFTSSEEVKDRPQQPVFLCSPSKEGVTDLPQQPLFLYGAPNDEVKDHPQLPLFLYGASKDEVKDHPQLPALIYGASKDEVKDHPQLPALIYGASKDEVKDHPQLPALIYGASKDEVKDHPQLPALIYGASKDEVSDRPQQPLFLYGASKDKIKDHPQLPALIYGVLKNEVKHHLQQPIFGYSASKNQPKDDPLAPLFFLKNDLYQGKEMKLHFIINNQKTAFLPKNIADSIPFSSKDLPEIYNKFSVKPDSVEGELIRQTLSFCEYKGIEGEEKFCATSLESMIDFATTKLGKNVKALSTEVNARESSQSQKYKIELVKKFTSNKVVVCHRLNYAYAVFYCHISVGTQSYAASLEGADGTRVKSVAVCHTDTSKWNPKYLAFHLLKVTPGSIPVCHFLPQDHVLWVQY